MSFSGSSGTGIGKQIPSIGQLVVNDMKKSSNNKKRRSKEHSNNEDDSSHYTNGKNQSKNCNKENIIETERLNRSANKKRLERLMNRAKDRSGSVPDNKYSRKERKSIKVYQRI